MAETIEELNLPPAIIQRIIKEALPKEDSTKLNVSKDVRSAAGKAAAMFILHLTTEALTCANEKKRKTLTGGDVIEAIKVIGFEHFTETLERHLEELSKKKKNSTKKNDSKNVSTVEEMEVEEDEEVEEDDGGEEEEEENDENSG